MAAIKKLSVLKEPAPVIGAIIDLKKTIHILHQSPLVVLYGLLGFETFIELMCQVALSEDADPIEDLESLLTVTECKALLVYDIDLLELHYELVQFQNYLSTDLIYHLPLRVKESFERHGFRITKWLSSTEVIAESNESELVRSKGKVSQFRSSTFQAVGSDRRSAENRQTLRDRQRIEDYYMPF